MWWLISAAGVLTAMWCALEALLDEGRYGKMFMLLGAALIMARGGGLV